MRSPDGWSDGVPRYYFNVYDGVAQPDREGIELFGIEVARAEALKFAGQIIRDAGFRGDPAEEWRIEVVDVTGAIVFLMKFTVTGMLRELRVSDDNHSTV